MRKTSKFYINKFIEKIRRTEKICKDEKHKYRKQPFSVEEDDWKEHEEEVRQNDFLKTVVKNRSMSLETRTSRNERELSFSTSIVN